MRKILVLLTILLQQFAGWGQTFNGTGGTIPGTATGQTCFPIVVTGVGNINTTSNGLVQVRITITHPNDDELEITLKAPDGTAVPLSIQNGGSGNNYTNTVFADNATNFIKAGTAPFTGTYQPEGYLGSVNNGQNANANWTLCIQDKRNAGNSGVLNSWSITFGNTPAILPPPATPCLISIPSSSSCTNATSICDFNGLCGATAGSVVNDWSGSGLGSCFGIQNNTFLKFMASATSASFSVRVPTSNIGYPNGGIQMIFFEGTCNSGAVTSHGCYAHIFPYPSAALPLATRITATGLVPGNVYYLMIDGYNNDFCSYSIAAESGVNIFKASPDTANVCQGTTVSMSAVGGSGTYSWAPGATLNATTGSSVTATPSVGTTLYEVTTTNVLPGCKQKDTVVVNVTALPLAPLVSPLPVQYCEGYLNANGQLFGSNLTATGSNLLWYTTATGGTGLDSIAPPTGSVAFLNYYVSQTVNGCEGPRASISVLILPGVTAPTVPTDTVRYCLNDPAVPLTATGTSIKWYTQATGGTGSTTAPTPSTLAAGTTDYYVTQSNTNCESPRTKITVIVSAIPSIPVASDTVKYCLNATATALTATGTNLLWYTTASGGTSSNTAPIPSTNSAGNFAYYVSQNNGNCESGRKKITVVVSAISLSPVVTSPVSYCQNATTTALSATGTGLLWYSTATGGIGTAVAPTPSSSSVGNTTYYVSQNSTGCEGPRASITVQISAAPAAPTVVNPIEYCLNATPTALTATGTNLLWYSASTGGTSTNTAPTPVTTATGNFTFYVSQSSGTCESPRALITVQVIAAPAAPAVTTPVQYCLNATASPLSATGTSLLWYTTAAGGTGVVNAPTPSTTATGSTIYYVSQTSNTCESQRTPITVTVVASAPLPTANTSIGYCQNAPASPLTATGSNLLWYLAATGGTGSATAPTPVTTVVGSVTYYVSQTISTCESQRLAIVVTVTASPVAPTVNTPVSYCQLASSIALTATGNGLLWYTNPTGGTGTSTAPVPSTTTAGTTIYYVSQTVSGCESQRAAISVQVNASPAAPVIVSPVNYCLNAPAVALSATGSNLLWYANATGGIGSSSVPVPSTNTTGTTNYYVSQGNGSCESPRALITVTVNPIPLAPSTTNLQLCQNATAVPLTASGTNLLWYTAATGGAGATSAPTPATNVSGSFDYYVSQTVSGCESPRSNLNVVIRPISSIPIAVDTVKYCQNESPLALSATGNNLLWYSTASGGVGTNSAPTPSTAIVGDVSYFVSQTQANSCESNRKKIVVRVSAIPTNPSVSSPVTYCQFFTSTPLTATGNNLSWYNSAAGGTGSATAPTPNTAITGNTNFYVSQQQNGCESGRSLITVTVNPGASAPVVSSPIEVCLNTGAVTLTATGSNLLWYTSATGGTGSTSNPVVSGTVAGAFNYYVSQTTSGCESPRSLITVNVNAVINPPTVTSPVQYCQGETPVQLTAIGNQLLWYSTATGGTGNTLAYTPSTSVPGNTTYYVSQSTATCESPRAAITVTVKSTPPSPFVISPVVYCLNNTASPLNAGGTNLLWYTSATGGTGSSTAPTPSTATLGNTAFYVSQTVNGCESPRVILVASVSNAPNPPAALNVSRCGPGTITVAAAASGIVKWYSDAALTSLLFIGPSYNTSITGTTIFYATNTVGTCVSAAFPVTATVNPINVQPTSFSYPSSSICVTASPVSPIPGAGFTNGGIYSSTTGLSINSITGIINPAASTPGSYIVTYAVGAAVCATAGSSTTPITITSTGVPVTNFSWTNSNICNNANPITPTYASGFSMGGTFTATPSGLSIDANTGVIQPSSSVAGNYQVTYSIAPGNCSLGGTNASPIQVVAAGIAPTVTNDQRCGPGTINLSASTTLGNINWYSDAGLTNLVQTGGNYSLALNANTTYYLTSVNQSCSSAVVTVTGTIFPIPVKPDLGKVTQLCEGERLTLQPGSYDKYLWQDGSVAPTFTVTRTGTYSVTVTSNAGCSNNASIQISVAPCTDIYFASAIAPLGTGNNRSFGALGNLLPVKDYVLYIYNRYGELVYNTTSAYDRWDGKIQGKEADPGNYVWQCVYRYGANPTKKKSGNLIVLR